MEMKPSHSGAMWGNTVDLTCVHVVLDSKSLFLNSNNSRVFCPVSVSQRRETNMVLGSVFVLSLCDV